MSMTRSTGFVFFFSIMLVLLRITGAALLDQLGKYQLIREYAF
jgi:hypothetical protein